MMTEIDKNEIISRILKIAREETTLVFNGYKPSTNDEHQEDRNQLTMLRCMVYGYNSNLCRIKKESHGTPFS